MNFENKTREEEKKTPEKWCAGVWVAVQAACSTCECTHSAEETENIITTPDPHSEEILNKKLWRNHKERIQGTDAALLLCLCTSTHPE